MTTHKDTAFRIARKNVGAAWWSARDYSRFHLACRLAELDPAVVLDLVESEVSA